MVTLFNTMRSLQTVFHGGCTILQSMQESGVSPTFAALCLLGCTCPSKSEVVFLCGFDLHFVGGRATFQKIPLVVA